MLAPHLTPNLEDQVLGFGWSFLWNLPSLFKPVRGLSPCWYSSQSPWNRQAPYHQQVTSIEGVGKMIEVHFLCTPHVVNEATIHWFTQLVLFVEVLYSSLVTGHEPVLHGLDSSERTNILSCGGSIHNARHWNKPRFHIHKDHGSRSRLQQPT